MLGAKKYSPPHILTKLTIVLRRVDATGRLGELLGLGAMDVHHEPTTSVRCEESWRFPYAPPEGGAPRSLPFYISPPQATRQHRLLG